MIIEQRKKLRDYQGIYEISSLGKLRSVDRYVYNQNGRYLKKGIYIKTNIHPRGYEIVTLNKLGKKKTFTIHRLVALNFIERDDISKEVNHKNGKRNQNNVENLEWVTRSENNTHSFRVLGRINPMIGIKGDKHHGSRKVIQLSLDGEYIKEWPSISSAAEYLGIGGSDITSVCKGYKISKGKKYKANHCKGYKWKYIF